MSNIILNESINDSGRLKCLFYMGIPGSGKTTIATKTSVLQPVSHINTDISLEFLSKKHGVIPNQEVFYNHRDKILTLTKTALFHSINGMRPIIVDSTSSNYALMMHRKKIIESFGYDTGMVYVDCDIELAKQRAAARNRKIDVDYIVAANDTITALVDIAKTKFTWFTSIDQEHNQSKTIEQFYHRPLANNIGKNIIEKLTDNKEKYLTDSLYTKEQITKAIATWV